MDLYMISTTDNPYSPVTHYDEWLTWDMARYNSNSLLARVVYTSPELSEIDQILAIQDGIDEIVRENVSGVHTKVKAGTFDNSSTNDETLETSVEEDQAA